MDARLEWLADRLRKLPWWRLAFACVFPLGLSVLWVVLALRGGHTVFVIVFGTLTALSLGVVMATILLKVRAGSR